MSKKSFSKKYLIFVFALYIIGSIFLFAFLMAAGKSGAQLFSEIPLSFLVSLKIALGFSLIPAGAYTGAVVAAKNAGEISKAKGIIIVILFPFILAFTIIFGIIVLIPYIIYSFYNILRS